MVLKIKHGYDKLFPIVSNSNSGKILYCCFKVKTRRSFSSNKNWVFLDRDTSSYFKHILLFSNTQLDKTLVSQLRNVFSNTYMNKYKINLYNIIYIFHNK